MQPQESSNGRPSEITGRTYRSPTEEQSRRGQRVWEASQRFRNELVTLERDLRQGGHITATTPVEFIYAADKIREAEHWVSEVLTMTSKG